MTRNSHTLGEFWLYASLSYTILSLIAVAVATLLSRTKTIKSEGPSAATTAFFTAMLKKPQMTRLGLTDSLILSESAMFEDLDMEDDWRTKTYEKFIKNGSLLLHCVTWAMFVYRTIRNFMSDPCITNKVYFEFPEVAEYFGMFFMIVLTAVCKSTGSAPLYWILVLLCCMYIQAAVLPPFQWGCTDLKRPSCANSESWYMQEAVNVFDCSPTAINATLLYMTWILFLPWLLPFFHMIHLTWIWLINYLAWTICYAKIKETWFFNRMDVCGRLFVLMGTVVIATLKKSYIETSGRKKYRNDMQMQQATEKIFRVFAYMVPSHVVVPMLKNPGTPIADPVERVTIMFIIITDFDRIAGEYEPQRLLQFLNTNFTKMDGICIAHGVTKIETVGEEYVACVGVVPDDIEEARRAANSVEGHRAILGRLFEAADAILRLQSAEMKFKIGVHTGAIVAGVIGNKLPRYRLFGDTINTAARMMQKGVEGKLQFGQETYNALPANVEASDRGTVEMKGKGMVQAYLFERITHKRSGRNTLVTVMDAPPKDDELFSAIIKELTHGSEAPQDNSLYSVFFEAFPAEMEETWFQEYHRTTFMKKFDQRVTRQIKLLLVTTGLEIAALLYIIVHYQRRLLNYAWRFPIFLCCRMISIGIAFFWRFVHSKYQDWLLKHPVSVQRYMLLSTCCGLVLTFMSYNVLTNQDAKGSTRQAKYNNKTGPPLDQLFLPIFVLMYFVGSTMQTFRFFPSFVYLPLSFFLMCLATSGGLGTLFLSTSGRVLFVLTCALHIVIAYNEELGHRSRYQAKTVVEETQRRTESILRTLMPPLVLEELRLPSRPKGADPPSHHYQKIMIQQSDLCGFTKLAATRQPEEVVDFMSELFGMFDDLTDTYSIYKVETIGDAYIAGQGWRTSKDIGPLTENYKPSDVVRFGLDSVKAVDAWSRRLGGEPVGCRVGIHYGQGVGGVVGTDMQRYHLFGEIMTVLEVMESCGIQGKVHISTAAYNEVTSNDGTSELEFNLRTDKDLRTSKGEAHSYDEAGGPTYFVTKK